MARKAPAEETEWLRANYAEGSIRDTQDAFEERFGRRPTRQALYVRACKMGLRKEGPPPMDRGREAARRISWAAEPEMSAWMLANDTGSMIDTMDAFREEFGFAPTRGQISRFRAQRGTQRGHRGGGREGLPVGTERADRDGIVVKVAENPGVPMSKGNWRRKHVLAYEEAHGPVPEGFAVYAVDGDKRNCDPGNLVAVDKRSATALNQLRREGVEWADREGMLAAAALAGLRVAIRDAEFRGERRCEVCGAEFDLSAEDRRRSYAPRTCPACRAAGLWRKGRRPPCG